MIKSSPRRVLLIGCLRVALSFAALIGVLAFASAQGEETGGIGGTGIGRRAVPVIGYGPIQRFGSVFVNNREYAINGRTLVSIDGVAAPVAALRVGDIVEVRGTAIGQHHGMARSIAVRDAIIGPVTQVTDGGRGFTVLGQQVIAVGDVPFAGVRAGVTVAVAAQRLPDGRWAAQRVTMLPISHTLRLQARVTALSGHRVVVAGTVFRLPKLGRTGLRPGQFVTVTGRMVAGVAQATRITPQPLLRGAVGTRIEVQDYFRSIGGGRMVADGLIATGAKALPDLDGIRPVEIQGRLTNDDTIAIGHVDVDLSALSASPALPRHAAGLSGMPDHDSDGTRELRGPADPDAVLPGIDHPDIDLVPDHDIDPPDIDIDPVK